jgi:hypothetical protein
LSLPLLKQALVLDLLADLLLLQRSLSLVVELSLLGPVPGKFGLLLTSDLA